MSQPNRTAAAQASRRTLMTGGLGVAAAVAALPPAATAQSPAAAKPAKADKSTKGSGYVTVRDGTQIFYKDGVPRPPSRSSSTTASR
jgi:non-heme chloroperoxidase